MIQSLAFFLPAIFCFLFAAFGIVCIGVALLGLKLRRRTIPEAAPPMLRDLNQKQRPGKGGFLWRLLRNVGVVALLMAVIGLWLTGFRFGWGQNPPNEWTDGRAPELEVLVRQHCAKFVGKGRTVGLAVAVVSSTNSTVMTFGRTSLVGGSPVRSDTLFEIGSITKTFTALALARAIDRGDLKLDQPVAGLLPPGVELPQPARDITLKNLTTHTSGFPRMPANTSPLASLNFWALGGNPYGNFEEADLFAAVRSVELQSTPGTKMSYSNFGMMLMGYLLAQKAGTNYEGLIRREILLPLEMTNTTITTPVEGRQAQGYRALIKIGPLMLALRAAPWFKSESLGGAGALRSSGADMLKYLQANMHPAGPLAHSLREVHEELFEANDRVAVGMNWMRTRNSQLKQILIWHNGGTGGFRSFLGFTEDSRIGVVVLANSADDVDSLGVGLLRDLNER